MTARTWRRSFRGSNFTRSWGNSALNRPRLSMQGGSKVTHCDRRCNQDQVLITLLIEVGLEVIGDALGETSLQFPVRIGPALFGVYGTALELEAANRSVGHKFTGGR